MSRLVVVTAAGTRQGPRARQPAGGRLAHGPVFSGSGCGYRDRDRRDPVSELVPQQFVIGYQR